MKEFSTIVLCCNICYRRKLIAVCDHQVVLQQSLSFTTMTASVRNLVIVLEMFFPSELPQKRAIYVLVTVTAIFPII